MKPVAIFGATLLGTVLATTTPLRGMASANLPSQLQPPDALAQEAQPQPANELVINVEITPEQQATIEAIYAEYAPQLEAAADALAAEAQAMDEISGPEATSAELRAQRQRLVAADAELKNLLFERLLAVREVLTVEQRQEFNRQIEETVNQR